VGLMQDTETALRERGWRDIALRVKGRIQEANLSMIAGGTAFFLLLGLVPGLAAVISIYGLIANPSDVQAQFDALAKIMPAEVRTTLEDQMSRIAGQHQTAGIAAVVSIVLALWGGAAAIKTLMNALNIIYREKEKRGYVKLTLVALALTVAFVVMGVVAIGIIVALPPLLAHLGLGQVGRTATSILRWPLLLAMGLAGLAVLYRYAPSRRPTRTTRPPWGLHGGHNRQENLAVGTIKARVRPALLSGFDRRAGFPKRRLCRRRSCQCGRT
jgi:membrane protein